MTEGAAGVMAMLVRVTAVPVPESRTEVVRPPALTESVPLRLPEAVGVNVTPMEQDAAAAREAPQPLLIE